MAGMDVRKRGEGSIRFHLRLFMSCEGREKLLFYKTNRYLHGVWQIACATPNYPPYPTTSPSPSSRFASFLGEPGEERPRALPRPEA
eukprot:scaffold144883_cov29-Tisochrysis_lutea.AAC.1